MGLYNSIGRVRTYFRAFIYKYFNKRIAKFLDPVLRKITKNNPKKYNAWVKDQYLHPSETGHTIDEILHWFEKNNIEFINSIPDSEIFSTYDYVNIFKKKSVGSYFERILSQFLMIFSRFGSEGGLFIMIGKKKSS